MNNKLLIGLTAFMSFSMVGCNDNDISSFRNRIFLRILWMVDCSVSFGIFINFFFIIMRLLDSRKWVIFFRRRLSHEKFINFNRIIKSRNYGYFN